jgi:hypothetical protein
VFGFVGTRKPRGKDAGAVVRLLVAIRAEHVIICTLFVVMLEKVGRLRCPLKPVGAARIRSTRVRSCSHPSVETPGEKVRSEKIVCHEQRDDVAATT